MAEDLKLKAGETNKVDPRVLAWLDSKDSAEDAGLVAPAGEKPGRVRVGVEFKRPLAAKAADALKKLGLGAEPGETAAWGHVSRQGLVTLARDANVVRIEPEFPVGLSK